MNLYIETDSNGNYINHPAFEDNLLEAFGKIPDHWETFVRIEQPVQTTYQVLDSTEPTYQKVNGVWTDVWAVRQMTDDEKAAKQKAVKDAWDARRQKANWVAWEFDESVCDFVPPIPRPPADQAKLVEGIFTVWCGAENNWKDTPPRPNDGKPYVFDFFAWTWVSPEGLKS